MIKYIIVTRLALKWRYQETNLSWNEWLNNSIFLMNNYCRPSLKNQTDQNFTILSLVDDSVTNYGNILENEIILKVKATNSIKHDIINTINEYVSNLNDCDAVILTRLDRDDCLHKNFVNIVKTHLSSGIEQYIDLNDSIIYDSINNIAYDSKKYNNTFVSPFVSTYEKRINGKIKCYSFIEQHSTVSKFLNGKKIDDLIALQVIHQYNLKNKVQGSLIKINKINFGIL